MELSVAATPTLAFCLTILPSPGMALSSAPSKLLTSCVFTPGATRPRGACGMHYSHIFSEPRRAAGQGGLRNALPQDFIDPQRRRDGLEPGHRHLQLAIEIAVGVERGRA